MKVETVQIDMELFGARFANAGDKDQAAFFKGLAAELRHYESQHAAQLQFAYVGGKLSDDDKKTLDNVLCMIVPEKK